MTNELQMQLDQRAIEQQLYRYCRAIDRGDDELLRQVYHPDAIDDHGAFRGNVEDVIAVILPALEQKYRCTTHTLSNILIDVDGDRAISESCVLASHLFSIDGVECNWQFSGRYIDRFERRGGPWRIARRQTLCDWEYLVKPERAMLAPGIFPGGLRSREDPAYNGPSGILK